MTRRSRDLARPNPAACRFDNGSPPGADLISADGSVSFRLTRGPNGLLLERAQAFVDDELTVACQPLPSVAQLDAWLALDPVRFDDPLLYQRLQRRGREVLG